MQALENGDLDNLSSAIRSTPSDVAPLDSIYHALLRVVGGYQTKEAMEINRLMRSNEALRARKQANYERQGKIVFAALCERWPGAEQHLRLIAMVGIGALRIAAERWTEEGMTRLLADYLKEALDGLRKELPAI